MYILPSPVGLCFHPLLLIVCVVAPQVLQDVAGALAGQMRACTVPGGPPVDRDATLGALVKCLTRLGKWLAHSGALASDSLLPPVPLLSRADAASATSPSTISGAGSGAGAGACGAEPPPTSARYWDVLATALRSGPGARKAPQWFLEQVLLLSGGWRECVRGSHCSRVHTLQNWHAPLKA